MQGRRIARLVLCAPLLLAGAAQGKSTLECYINPATRAATCIDPAKATVNGDLRASPLFTGGPNQVDATPYYIVVNCKKDIVTLQDRKGVNFAGDKAGATDAVRSLSKWLCEVPKPRQDKKLQQFGG
jgi:hypothetical protein